MVSESLPVPGREGKTLLIQTPSESTCAACSAVWQSQSSAELKKINQIYIQMNKKLLAPNTCIPLEAFSE